MATPTIALVQTRVGQPGVIGHTPGGKPVYSSIGRKPTKQDELYLTPTGLAGDQATNTAAKLGGGQMHGGHDKAIYVYPRSHYPVWRKLVGPQGMCGRSLGENWLVDNLVGLPDPLDQLPETAVHIGDVWQLGSALLRVSKPRTPCATLVRYFGGIDMNLLMWTNGRCGWYLEVLEPGLVPTFGGIEVVHRELSAPTVSQQFAAKRAQQPQHRPR